MRGAWCPVPSIALSLTIFPHISQEITSLHHHDVGATIFVPTDTDRFPHGLIVYQETDIVIIDTMYQER